MSDKDAQQKGSTAQQTSNTAQQTGNTAQQTSNAAQQMRVRWENSTLQSVYANVCNVAGTREEIVLLFGMNQAFDAAQNEMTIQLSNRIVMSPFVAKRLARLLNNIVGDYETKYGSLDE